MVTETLYALAVRRTPPWVPTEVILLTTAEGAERARLSLLSDDPGWFHRLLQDYQLPAIAFDPSRIEILADAGAAPLPDIRGPEDNEIAADAITERVRLLTADPDTALHVSIAGGRKTMGYYAGYALSLFGRPQDRLSHVLVSEPFESSWAFFYPTPRSRVITTRDNTLADSAEARVTLAEIPFVSLRDGLPERLLRGQARFGDTVAAARRALAPPSLVLDLAAGRIQAGGEGIVLPPASLAFYALMARRRLAGRHAVRWDAAGLAADLLDEYQRIAGELAGDLERARAALAGGMSEEYFESRKSRTNTALQRALGPKAAQDYLIHPFGSRPRTRYGLRLDPAAIRFAPLPGPGEADAGASLPAHPSAPTAV